jgi:hypothetical protein
MSKLRALMKLKPNASSLDLEPESDDSEILKISKVVMEFIGNE